MNVATEEGLGTIDAAPAPDASVATPGASPYHGVTDHELDRVVTFQPPVPIAVAGVFAGVFIGTVTAAVKAIFAIGGDGAGLGDVVLVMVNALALGIAATAAVFAVRGKAETAKTMAAIRNRGRITIAPETEIPPTR